MPVSQTGSTAGKKSSDEGATAPAKESKPSTATAGKKSSHEGATAPAKESKPSTATAVEKEGRETEISQAYQIFPDEVLGSGQFGIVYGGVHS
jgi:hypothetical protein